MQIENLSDVCDNTAVRNNVGTNRTGAGDHKVRINTTLERLDISPSM